LKAQAIVVTHGIGLLLNTKFVVDFLYPFYMTVLFGNAANLPLEKAAYASVLPLFIISLLTGLPN
jgi:hypothetical protein